MTADDASRPVDARARTLLALAAVAVAFAAADTYVVVLALPDMMAAADLPIEQLQRAAPIVSGFLLGYVALLPLVGRIADLRGRVPVLLGSLVVFAVGSIVTAAAYDLSSMVVGRFLQGVGGGGLVPATLALVADRWPPERRGLPLGVVGAVQEIGSVIGPLYGAAVLAVADWRTIFWLNAAVGLVLAAALLPAREPSTPRDPSAISRPSVLALVATPVLATVALGSLALVMLQPASLVTDVEIGLAFLAVVGESRWLSPLALVAYAAAALLVAAQLLPRPVVRLRTWPDVVRRIDLPGAAALSVALGLIIVTFASADPETAAVPASAPLLLGLAVVALAAFWWRQRTASEPLLAPGTLAQRPAWGGLVVSFLVGAALIAALVDVPFFARLTVSPDSQLDAALVLLRLLVALPVGAVLGGWLMRYTSAATITAPALLATAGAFVVMSRWDLDSLESTWSTAPLVVAGLGFGLALAPINAAVLAHTRDDAHGVASAAIVVARMVGMLVGISVLTTVGLRRFYAAQDDLPSPSELCPSDPVGCPELDDRLLEAGLVQLQTVFAGAAVCAALGAVLALWLLRPASTRIP